MTLRFDYLKDKLGQHFNETMVHCCDRSKYDSFHFPPMLFIINSDWEFIGGPDCEDDFSDFDTLIAMAEAAVQIFADTGQKLVPYIATATSGFAVNEDDSDDVVRSRLFTIYGDDINYSKIEFSDKRMPFITNEIPDSTIDAGLRKLLDVIKNLNN